MLTTRTGEVGVSENGVEMAYLKCSAQASPFPHELGVSIRGIKQNYESIIDADLIYTDDLNDGQTHASRVEITIIKSDPEVGALLVELPRQVVMGGRRIWVPESEVEPINSNGHSFRKGNQETPQ